MKLVEVLREDLYAHGSDWTRPGFQALAVHRIGRWARQSLPRWVRAPIMLWARAAHVFCRNFYGIELPFSAAIGHRVVFEHQHGIVVHGNSVIGDDCILRQGVTLGIRRMDRLQEAPVLGRGVSVGAGAKLLGYILVGDGALIGANAVVLSDVPARMKVVGAPARPVAGIYSRARLFS